MTHPAEQRVYCVIQPGKPKSRRIAEAVVAGFGGYWSQETTSAAEISPSFLPVVIGLHECNAPILRDLRKRERPFLYVDNGYFNAYPNGDYFRVTMNGLQCVSKPVELDPVGAARFAALDLEYAGWRERRGPNILVPLQSERWFSLLGYDRNEWVSETIDRISRFSRRTIVLRDKPVKDNPGRPFAEDLEDAHAVVSFSSNTMIQATLAGIPVFPLGPCGSTPLSCGDLHQIESPDLPDNQFRVWSTLANNQWTLEEMKNGVMRQAFMSRPVPAFQDLA